VEIENDPLDLIGLPVDIIEDEVIDEKDEQQNDDYEQEIRFN